MPNEPKVPLIGGSNHGESVKINRNVDEIEIDIHTTEAPTSDSTFTEAYERRYFDGEEFGEGFECFALKTDDDTEQRELARWALSHESNNS